jgi:hypothetical protein
VGAVDAGAVHAGGDQIVDEFGFRGRFGRQGRHHPGARAASLPSAEQPVRLSLQFRRARRRRRRSWIGGAQLAGQALERGDERVEGERHLALAAAERRQPPRRQPILKVGEVMFAQRDVMGKIQHSGGNLIRPGAPCASELGSLALDILAQRFHLGEKAAEVFEVASEFSSHQRRFA